MRKNFVLTAGLFFGLHMIGAISAATYDVDSAHSSVNFKIRHLLSNVTGSFGDFSGSFTTDDKTGALKTLNGTVKVDSINTANAKRDNHLKSADFFNVDEHDTATLSFKDLNIKKGQTAKAKGELTLHGTTKTLTWNIKNLGSLTVDGKEKGALTATIDKLPRKDFGLTWNKPLEKAGEMMIGDDVAVEVNVEANRAKMDTTTNLAKEETTKTTTTTATKKK